MRKSLAGAVLLLVAAGACADGHDHSYADITADFQFVQDGKVILPQHGVLTLAARPFSISYVGGHGRPSILAGAGPVVTAQLARLRDPLATWAGTGSAAGPERLEVQTSPLELFNGQSADFDARWGRVFGLDHADFDALAQSLGKTPQVMVSGHNYANFVGQADGSLSYVVNGLNDQDFPATDFHDLQLLLLEDVGAPVSPTGPCLLHYATLAVQFEGAPCAGVGCSQTSGAVAPPAGPVQDTPKFVMNGIRSAGGRFFSAYQHLLREAPDARGKITFHFDIAADGSVSAVTIVRDDIGSDPFSKKLLDIARSITFQADHAWSGNYQLSFVPARRERGGRDGQ